MNVYETPCLDSLLMKAKKTVDPPRRSRSVIVFTSVVARPGDATCQHQSARSGRPFETPVRAHENKGKKKKREAGFNIDGNHNLPKLWMWSIRHPSLGDGAGHDGAAASIFPSDTWMWMKYDTCCL